VNTLRTPILIVAVVFAALASPVVARESCTRVSLKDDYKRAAIVMLGEALPSQPGEARFRLIRAWKGDPHSEVVFDAAQLERRFVPGQKVLVFGYVRAGAVPYVHDCSHTNPLTAAFVHQAVQTISSRSAWWNCPLSSFTLRGRADAP
jgi:hypothetical protein